MHTANSIPLMKIVSSQLAAIGHDPATETLAIQFLRKGEPDCVYHYANFSATEYTAFAGAESVGKHFYAHIKPHADKHPFTNMGVPAPAAPAAAPLSKEMLAMLLNGRQYGDEITPEEDAAAKAAGLLVIFGASDDLMEFRGVECTEIYCHGGGAALIDAAGVLPTRDDIEDDAALKDFFARQPLAVSVEALSCEEEDFAWTYRTAVPHATFEISADGGQYCRGIVINVADLAPAAAAKLAADHAMALDINARCYGKQRADSSRYSRTTFKDNGDPILLNADGSRSVFCDLSDDMEAAA